MCKLLLCSWGELDRWMGCRWEELARHEAFKAGLEMVVQRGEEEDRRRGGSEAGEDRCY